MPTPRKPDWAQKIAYRRPYLNGDGVGMVHPDNVADYLRAEYRRAVRIVQRLRIPLDEEINTDYKCGYEQACLDILAALRKGRK